MGAQIGEKYVEVKKLIAKQKSIALIATMADVKQQLDSLVYEGFISGVAGSNYENIERYLRACIVRIEKAISKPANDESCAWQIGQAEEKIEKARVALASKPFSDQGICCLEEARWMLEEFRVSLFAQSLGTKGKISLKRIEKTLREI